MRLYGEVGHQNVWRVEKGDLMTKEWRQETRMYIPTTTLNAGQTILVEGVPHTKGTALKGFTT
jgi:hypothetical protein